MSRLNSSILDSVREHHSSTAVTEDLGIFKDPATRRAIGTVVACFVASRIVLLFEALWLADRSNVSLVHVLSPWDSFYYVQIATYGYPSTVDVHYYSTTAFFPLFPILGRMVSDVTSLSPSWGLIAMSWLAGLAIAILAIPLAMRRWDLQRSRQAAIVLVLFPGSFVIGWGYSDGLAIALSMAALLALSRNKFLLGGLFGLLASATLPLVVLPLILASAWAALRSRRITPFVAPLLTPFGALAYFGYLWAHTGSPLTWARVEKYAWGTRFVFPWSDRTFNGPFNAQISPAAYVIFAGVVVGLLAVVLLFVKRTPIEWQLFSIFVLAAVLFNYGPWLTTRFLFDAFPIALVLGAVIPKRVYPYAAALSFLMLVGLYVAYSPGNTQFFNP